MYFSTPCFAIPEKLVHRSGSSLRPPLAPTYFDVVDPSPFYTKQAAPRGFLIRIVATYRAVRPPERAVQRAVTKGRTYAPASSREAISRGFSWDVSAAALTRKRIGRARYYARSASSTYLSPRVSNLYL